MSVTAKDSLQRTMHHGINQSGTLRNHRAGTTNEEVKNNCSVTNKIHQCFPTSGATRQSRLV